MNTFFVLAVLAVLAVHQVSALAFKPFGAPGSTAKKAAPAPAAAAPKKASASTSKAAAAAPKKVKKDMTWGGRPDAAPEMQVVDTGFSAPVGKSGLAFAPWRYNQEN